MCPIKGQSVSGQLGSKFSPLPQLASACEASASNTSRLELLSTHTRAATVPQATAQQMLDISFAERTKPRQLPVISVLPQDSDRNLKGNSFSEASAVSTASPELVLKSFHRKLDHKIHSTCLR